MAGSRQDELYDALQLKGYPEDFCREIAYRQMNTDCGIARCDSCDSRVHTSILYPCYGDCKIVSEIPEYGAASRCAWLSASCGGGDDRISRDSDHDLSILGQCTSNIL